MRVKFGPGSVAKKLDDTAKHFISLNLNFVCKMRRVEPISGGLPDLDQCDYFAKTEGAAVRLMSVPGNRALLGSAACCRVEYGMLLLRDTKPGLTPHWGQRRTVCLLLHESAFPFACSRVRLGKQKLPLKLEHMVGVDQENLK